MSSFQSGSASSSSRNAQGQAPKYFTQPPPKNAKPGSKTYIQWFQREQQAMDTASTEMARAHEPIDDQIHPPGLPGSSHIPGAPGSLPSAPPNPSLPPRGAQAQPGRIRPRHNFSALFHALNLTGSVGSALSAIGCGLGSFAHIGEYCSKTAPLRKCVAAGAGMASVIVGVCGATGGIGLGVASLYRGEGQTWHRWNFAISLLNIIAALSAGGPAMYGYFNNDHLSTCDRVGSANVAAFSGFWIGVAGAAALLAQEIPRSQRGLFRVSNTLSTIFSAAGAILGAAPDLCSTVQTVRHRGGGQGFVAVVNCIGVAVGIVGVVAAIIGTFAPDAAPSNGNAPVNP